MIWNRSLSASEINQLYKSQITKYTSTDWSFYTNESINTSTSDYTYYLCVSNSTGYENCTTQQTLTYTIPSANITINFSKSVGTISNNFYGVNTHGIWGSNESWINAYGNGTLIRSNYTWHRDTYLEGGISYLRADMALDDVAYENHTFKTTASSNYANINTRKNLVEWAYNNNVKVLFIASYMPAWLANTTYNCSDDTTRCVPTNFTRWGELVTDFLDAVDCDVYSDTCEVEVWSEPDYDAYLLPDIANDEGVNDYKRALAYLGIYNATYNAIKSTYPSMRVGAPSISDRGGSAQILINSFLSNFTNQFDFITVHEYGWQNTVPPDSYDTVLNGTLTFIKGRCETYNSNCSVYIAEWNDREASIKNTSSRQDEFAVQVALGYGVILNNYLGNTSKMIMYQWASSVNYSTGHKWEMVAEPKLENEYYVSYNVTKNYATYCPSGGTVVSSTNDDSTIKQVGCIDGGDYNLIVINSGSESKNVTLALIGYPYSAISNLETNENYTVTSGTANIGYVSSNEILYLGGEDTTAPIISNVINHSITSSNAIINWTTDELSNSTVYYGINSSVLNTTSNSSSVLLHSINLTNLTSNTLYYYNVSSCDSSGNCVTSSQYSFTTLSVPITITSSPSAGGASGGALTLEQIQQQCLDKNMSWLIVNNTLYCVEQEPEPYSNQVTTKKFVDRVLSKKSNINGVCEDGENWLLDEDCKLSLDIFMCKTDCVWNYMWWYRLLILGFLFYYIRNKNKNIKLTIPLIIIVVLFLVSNMPVDTTPKPQITYLNESNSTGFTEDWFYSLGDKVSPSHPIIGWVVIVFILMLLLKGWDWIDMMLDRYIYTMFRRR